MLTYSIHTTMAPSDVLDALRSTYRTTNERNAEWPEDPDAVSLTVLDADEDAGNVYATVTSEANNDLSPDDFTRIVLYATESFGRQVVHLIRNAGHPVIGFDDGGSEDRVYDWDVDLDAPTASAPTAEAS